MNGKLRWTCLLLLSTFLGSSGIVRAGNGPLGNAIRGAVLGGIFNKKKGARKGAKIGLAIGIIKQAQERKRLQAEALRAQQRAAAALQAQARAQSQAARARAQAARAQQARSYSPPPRQFNYSGSQPSGAACDRVLDLYSPGREWDDQAQRDVRIITRRYGPEAAVSLRERLQTLSAIRSQGR